MSTSHRSGPQFRPDLTFILLAALLTLCLLAGGASRADVMGQVVVRGTAWLVLLAMSLGGHVRAGLRPVVAVLTIFGAVVALPLMQLIPLPPGVWQALPGRASLTAAATSSGQPQPWRSLAIVPGAAVNAAASLVVPGAVLILMAGLKEATRRWVPALLLVLILLDTIIGLLQFSGVGFDNPLVNDTPGQVSGLFANRNHFALLLAIGCLLAPGWAFLDGRKPRWRGPLAIGLILLFFLVLLASGSRAGLLTGLLALALALGLVWRALQRTLRHGPRWALPALVSGVLATISVFVLVSLVADRAESINRAMSVDAASDMRTRALPTVLAMTKDYFPAGAGFGGFDEMFRIHEPFALLKPTYFNHAHNDFLEIVLDGGLPGALLLAVAVGWWLVSSARAWRGDRTAGTDTAKLGSAMLLLTMIASSVDYPARTPMMMAIIAIAADWLARGTRMQHTSALPDNDHDL